MPQRLLEYQNVTDSRRDRNARWLRLILLTTGGLVASFVLLVVGVLTFVNYEQTFRVKRLFAKSNDWDVVEIRGFSEEHGYTVTGVLLAIKGRPDATVELCFSHWTSLRDNEEITIVSINGLDLEAGDVQRRLLANPCISKRQRYELRYHNGTINVKSDGHFTHLFPHPIRDLADLRVYYDEVDETFRSIAAGSTPNVAR
jgi:hypothetical protein